MVVTTPAGQVYTGTETVLNNLGIHLTALRPAGGAPPGPTAKPWTRAFVVE